MPAIPNWLQGRDIDSIVVTPQTAAATGTLSAGTPITLTWLADQVRVSIDPTVSNISPLKTTIANNVIEEDDITLTITEILRRNDNATAVTNLLADAFINYDYFTVSIGRGGRTWLGYCTRGSYSEGVTSKGKNVGEATFRIIDVDTTATADLTYT